MIKTRLIRLLKGSGKYIAANIFWQWLGLLFQIIAVFAAGLLLEHLFKLPASGGNVDKEIFFKTAGAVLAAILVRFVCEKQAARASYRASADVKAVLREKIYRKLLRLGAAYKDKVPTSEVVQVSVEGVEQLEVYYGRYLPQLFYSLLAPVTLFAALSWISAKACAVLLICVPLIPVSIVAVQKFAKKLLSRYWGIYTELGDSFLENLQGLTTLKIYQADARKAEEMDEEAEKFRRITMKVLTMQLNSVSVMDLVAYGGAAAGMIVTAMEYAAGNVSISGAFTIILLASEFFIPLRLLGSFFHIAMNGMSASDRIFRILDMEEPKQGDKTVSGDKMEIVLSDVGYSYEPERSVLSGVSMEIPAGKFITLAGLSGCGKSTAAALITGRNKGYSGQILINGIPADEISEASLMDKITLVRHNSYLFKGTVEDNLRMGAPSASREDMMRVLKEVNLYDFLKNQGGLETRLDEQGSNLSGGQRQRLAIARALLHDSDMYIFDEAASNIDVESEDRIMEVIRSLAGKKTVLFISHRLANAVFSDCIYMMEEGRITEQGTHRELMKKNGSYAHMYLRQQELCGAGDTDHTTERKVAGA